MKNETYVTEQQLELWVHETRRRLEQNRWHYRLQWTVWALICGAGVLVARPIGQGLGMLLVLIGHWTLFTWPEAPTAGRLMPLPDPQATPTADKG